MSALTPKSTLVSRKTGSSMTRRQAFHRRPGRRVAPVDARKSIEMFSTRSSFRIIHSQKENVAPARVAQGSMRTGVRSRNTG